jgi:hypothetical protein
MTAEFIIIIILLIYIGVLHFQLYQKSKFVETIILNNPILNDKGNKVSVDDIIRKLKVLTAETLIKPNKLFEKEVQDFILDDEKNRVLYIHYTKDKDVADRINSEGFRFVDSFYKTAEPISSDKLDMVYKHYLHKHYGAYVIIIAFEKQLYDKYINAISRVNRVLNVEQLLSKKCSQLNENLDEVYLLPNCYVKGYINSETGEIISNPDFNPSFDSPDFINKVSGQ